MKSKPHSTTSLRGRLFASSVFAVASVATTAAIAGELVIEVSGAMPNRGKVYVALYDRAAAFPIDGRQLTGQILSPQAPHVTVRFTDLPPGSYAAVAFQDLNGNGKLDKNFLGIPKEPYGFSNGARGSAGPPKFAEAAVSLNPDGATAIALK